MTLPNQQLDLRLIGQIRDGCADALEYLIVKYTPMVRHIVRKYEVIGVEPDDLAQEGMIGLLSAIREYRPDRFDVKFSSFAYLCIQRKISNAVKQNTGNKHKLLNYALSLHTYVNSEESRTRLDYVPEDVTKTDPGLLVEQRLLDERLHRLLADHLSSLEYIVAVLLVEGYTARDIEREFGLEAKRVDNARTRVKAKVRRLIHTFGSLDHPAIPKQKRRRHDLALQIQLN